MILVDIFERRRNWYEVLKNNETIKLILITNIFKNAPLLGEFLSVSVSEFYQYQTDTDGDTSCLHLVAFVYIECHWAKQTLSLTLRSS